MSKIVKNTTLSDINISDVGVTVFASSQYTIPANDYLLWASSDDIVTYVGSGDIVINDGTEDLGISDGIDLIKGLYPKSLAARNQKITNLSLTANTEATHTFENNLLQFTLRNRDSYKVQIAFVSGQSNTTYLTLKPSCSLTLTNLDFTNTNIYVQSDNSSILEILELYY